MDLFQTVVVFGEGDGLVADMYGNISFIRLRAEQPFNNYLAAA